MPTKNVLVGKNFRTVAEITASEDGKLPKKIMVLPIGDWNTYSYGPMQVNSSHLQQIVANFKSGVRKLVPIDVDHDAGKAAGWIDTVEASDDGLYANVTWTPYGEELLGGKIYRLFSPEWSFDYVDPEHGSKHGAVLIAGSLTNRPLFKELPVLTASEGKKNKKGLTNTHGVMLLLGSDINSPISMDINEILKKKASDRTEEEVAFLKEKASELNDEQKKQLADEGAAAEAAKKEAEEKAAKEKAEKEAAEKAEAERKAREEAGDTVVAASELKRLQDIEKDHIKAKEKLLRNDTEKELKKFMANENGGHLLPKAYKDGSLLDMVMTFSEDQKKAFYSFIESLPEIKIAHVQGDDNPEAGSAKERMDSLVAKAMQANDKLTKNDAMKKVMRENPELSKQYTSSLK